MGDPRQPVLKDVLQLVHVDGRFAGDQCEISLAEKHPELAD